MDNGIIIVDLDDVIVVPNFLNIANEITGESKEIKDLKEYYVEDNFSFTEEQREFFYDELVKRNLYENSKLIEGAYDTLKELSKEYEVFIASDSIICEREKLSGKLFFNKYNFIVENLPFINPRNIILTGDKSVICGKYMLDDKLQNLLKNHNIKYKLLFTAYHNRELDDKALVQNCIMRIDGYDMLYRRLHNKLHLHEISKVINQILIYFFDKDLNYGLKKDKNLLTIYLDSNDIRKLKHDLICGGKKIKEKNICNKIFKILNIKANIEVQDDLI